jgi:catechol 2,3-dioxygenase
MGTAMDNGACGVRAAVHSIDHFTLNVPSIPDARHFFTAFGLEVSEVATGRST